MKAIIFRPDATQKARSNINPGMTRPVTRKIGGLKKHEPKKNTLKSLGTKTPGGHGQIHGKLED